METLLYVLLGAVLYGLVARHSDRVADRELNNRRFPPGGPALDTTEGVLSEPR